MIKGVFTGHGDKKRTQSIASFLQLDDENLQAGYELQDLAGRGDIKAITELLQGMSALVNWKDSSGWTALHETCSTSGNSRTLETARLLLEHGADPLAKDENDTTPLHTVCENGDTATARLLMEKAAGRSAVSISHASEDGIRIKREMLLMLDANGKTPFHYACESSSTNVEIRTALLDVVRSPPTCPPTHPPNRRPPCRRVNPPC